MSLELASFIKDLVATNPQGTDPKSQGDDHLRLIKGVLQNQFPGFTDGVGITKTETQINSMLAANEGGLGGILFDELAGDINALPAITKFYGIGPSTTGTFPTTGAAGDVLQVLAYSTSHIVQVWYGKATPMAAFRRWSDVTSSYSAWRPLWMPEARISYAYGSGYSNSNGAGARKLNGIVNLEGAIARSSPIGTAQTILTLPVGFRPQFERGVLVMAQYSNLATQAVNCQILTTGVIQTSYVVTIGGTPSGTCTFWLADSFVAADVIT